MPTFEDNELQRGEPMPDDLREEFLAKRERLEKKRLEEIKELEDLFLESDER